MCPNQNYFRTHFFPTILRNGHIRIILGYFRFPFNDKHCTIYHSRNELFYKRTYSRTRLVRTWDNAYSRLVRTVS